MDRQTQLFNESYPETDSGAEDTQSQVSNVSAESSLFRSIEKYGRTYHAYKEGKYFLPNDGKEQDRLERQHALVLVVCNGKFHLAPVTKPNRALDIGTGTGTWAIGFAEANPESDVLGTDLSPIQPEWVPPNCRFEIDDVEDAWTFSYKFDYIHWRGLSLFFTKHQEVIASVYANLQPGGWFECCDWSLALESQNEQAVQKSSIWRWYEYLKMAMRNLRRDMYSSSRHKEWMEKAGFAHVVEKRFEVPVGDWHWHEGEDGKSVGRMNQQNIMDVLSALSVPMFADGLDWKKEEIEVLLASVRTDVQNSEFRLSTTLLIYYGQKPVT